MPDPLATPADLATYIENDVDTANATLVLEYASAVVRAYCGWEITSFSASGVVLDSDGTSLITVPCLRVTNVSTVELLSHGDWSEVTDYAWSAMGALHRSCWPRGFRTVRVSYTGGYDDVPAGITAVTCSLASRQLNPLGLYSETVGGISQGFQREPSNGISVNALNGVEMILLDRYRIAARP